jgi:hypothetical protein
MARRQVGAGAAPRCGRAVGACYTPAVPSIRSRTLAALVTLVASLALAACEKRPSEPVIVDDTPPEGTLLSGTGTFASGTEILWSSWTGEILYNGEPAVAPAMSSVQAYTPANALRRTLGPGLVNFALSGDGQRLYGISVSGSGPFTQDLVRVDLPTADIDTLAVAGAPFVMGAADTLVAYSDALTFGPDPDSLRLLGLVSGVRRALAAGAVPLAMSPDASLLWCREGVIDPAGQHFVYALPAGPRQDWAVVTPDTTRRKGPFHWDSNGLKVAWGAGNPARIGVLDVFAGVNRELYSGGDYGDPAAAVWSPDGKRLAVLFDQRFTLTVNGQPEPQRMVRVLMVDAEFGGGTLVAQGLDTPPHPLFGAPALHGAFAPDGQGFVYLLRGQLYRTRVR